jgi:hypothetical protein
MAKSHTVMIPEKQEEYMKLNGLDYSEAQTISSNNSSSPTTASKDGMIILLSSSIGQIMYIASPTSTKFIGLTFTTGGISLSMPVKAGTKAYKNNSSLTGYFIPYLN